MKFKNRLKKSICITTFLIVGIIKWADGQDSLSRQVGSLLSEGVFVYNLNTIVAWGSDFDQLPSDGRTRVLKNTKTQARVAWDSVQILNGIVVNMVLSYVNPHGAFTKSRQKTLMTLRCIFDSGKVQQLSDVIMNTMGGNLHIIGKYHHDHNVHGYAWSIDGCYVKLGVWRKYGGVMIIQKMRPRKT